MRIRWSARRSATAAMPFGRRTPFVIPDSGCSNACFDGRIAAFMVVERPTDSSRFWSLVALAPELSGKGLGRRIWCAVLAMHHHEGVEEVATSISSHNSIVHNLYVSLGFRFPLPEITLHWCPSGPLRSGTA